MIPVTHIAINAACLGVNILLAAINVSIGNMGIASLLMLVCLCNAFVIGLWAGEI